MTDITDLKVDPDAAGLDARRLERIEDHLRQRYLDPQKIPGCQVAVARNGQLGYFKSLGSMDLERGRPLRDDTIFRIYSMSKPVTGVALMSLYESGHFQLGDPVSRFIPEWENLKVREGDALVDPQRPMTVKDLLMHMSGLGYGRPPGQAGAAAEAAAASTTPPALRALAWMTTEQGMTLEKLTGRLAERSLRFHPGTRWLYSLSTDICGRLVEIISGKPLDEYMQSEIFGPLGMRDTGFVVPEDKAERFAANYRRRSDKTLKLADDPFESVYLKPRTFLSGGGGLVSTTADYLRFTQMLLNGGELDGVRVLGRKTVELMSLNHLPGGGELRSFALPNSYGETGFDGVGFGLTMAVGLGQREQQAIGSAGEYYWGGAASTIFWIDPVEDLIVVFMTQLFPSGTFNFRGQLKSIVYPALSD